MTNYFYFDRTYQEKQGPVNEQQLKELAVQRVITPTTQIVSDTGHSCTAGQLPGLFGNPSAPTQKAAKSWLFDFAFRDIRIHIVNLWACRIAYVICWIAAILWGIVGTNRLCKQADHFDTLIPILLVPLVWLGIVFIVFFARLFLEFCLILVDWMVETTKAARLYMENNKEEREK